MGISAPEPELVESVSAVSDSSGPKWRGSIAKPADSQYKRWVFVKLPNLALRSMTSRSAPCSQCTSALWRRPSSSSC